MHNEYFCHNEPHNDAPSVSVYVRAERARVDRTAYIPHTRTRGFHTEGRRSRASDPCIPACASLLTVCRGPIGETSEKKIRGWMGHTSTTP